MEREEKSMLLYKSTFLVNAERLTNSAVFSKENNQFEIIMIIRRCIIVEKKSPRVNINKISMRLYDSDK